MCLSIKKGLRVNFWAKGYMHLNSDNYWRGLPQWLSSKESTSQCRSHELRVPPLSQKGPLEEGMTTHPSIFDCKIPWTEKPGGLQSKGLQRIGYAWVTEHAHTHSTLNTPIKGTGFFWGNHWFKETFVGLNPQNPLSGNSALAYHRGKSYSFPQTFWK